jgi:hypothetical protein
MDNHERDRIIIETHGAVQGLVKDMEAAKKERDDMRRTLYGNGQPGIVKDFQEAKNELVRVATIQKQASTIRQAVINGVISTIIAGTVGFVVLQGRTALIETRNAPTVTEPASK